MQIKYFSVSDLLIFRHMDRIELGAKKVSEKYLFARLYGIISGMNPVITLIISFIT